MPEKSYPPTAKKRDRLFHHWFQVALSLLSLVIGGLVVHDWVAPKGIISSFVFPQWPQVALSFGTLCIGGSMSLHSLIFVDLKRLKHSWRIERVAMLFLIAGWLGIASFSLAQPNAVGAIVSAMIAFSFVGRFFLIYRIEAESDALVSSHRAQMRG